MEGVRTRPPSAEFPIWTEDLALATALASPVMSDGSGVHAPSSTRPGEPAPTPVEPGGEGRHHAIEVRGREVDRHNDWCSAAWPRGSAATEGHVGFNSRAMPRSCCFGVQSPESL